MRTLRLREFKSLVQIHKARKSYSWDSDSRSSSWKAHTLSLSFAEYHLQPRHRHSFSTACSSSGKWPLGQGWKSGMCVLCSHRLLTGGGLWFLHSLEQACKDPCSPWQKFSAKDKKKHEHQQKLSHLGCVWSQRLSSVSLNWHVCLSLANILQAANWFNRTSIKTNIQIKHLSIFRHQKQWEHLMGILAICALYWFALVPRCFLNDLPFANTQLSTIHFQQHRSQCDARGIGRDTARAGPWQHVTWWRGFGTGLEYGCNDDGHLPFTEGLLYIIHCPLHTLAHFIPSTVLQSK